MNKAQTKLASMVFAFARGTTKINTQTVFTAYSTCNFAYQSFGLEAPSYEDAYEYALDKLDGYILDWMQEYGSKSIVASRCRSYICSLVDDIEEICTDFTLYPYNFYRPIEVNKLNYVLLRSYAEYLAFENLAMIYDLKLS